MSSGIPGWSAEEERFVDRLDRVTWRVARVLALGVPVWVLLLLAVPNAIPPIGPMPALGLATLGAAGACWAMERRVGRARRPPSADPPAAEQARGRRRPGMRALILTGAAALFAVYAILVIVAGGGR